MASAISSDLSAQIIAQMNQQLLLAQEANAAQASHEQTGTQTNSSLGAGV
jgi:hypothetical protein